MSDKRSVNLCSIYVLPLLGLNRFSFGAPERFINSYVSEDSLHVVVECTHPCSLVISNHANFKFEFKREEKHLAVFEVPIYYKEDVIKFKEGKYSKLSDSAKTLIRKKSGLTYKVPIPGGGFKSALELLALDKDKELKLYWEKRIGEKLPEEAELQSIPGEDNYYTLNITNKLEESTC